ncbi:FBD-associated F-box protein At4g10400 [Brachypodium distachyon]|uniref:Uncharacterized protein n=1 Tax=Brachypodium distachyon TaxID=15368 RepID=I1HEA1_BRADI|nr:FBD-associated F-box protein At4g10400 [Brachypodium distachyon]KQK03806.1 hypothetical protein BRADI_2g09930v3 [Brachypodium distachyon]|eukprot:XP_003565630.1 FBD-associated F-box protein At4g10400 [Brachypodium distachyon]
MAAGAAEDPQDRLSGLPDDVLHSIIGRVPFKQAVRTNALSRRWPRLWLHALAASGVLDFTDRGFVRSQSRAHIVATVNRCLRVRGGGAPIDVLRVSLCPFGAFERDVVGWIAAALRRGAREVDVNLTQGRVELGAAFVNCRTELELPGDLFCAESSLARLSLGRCSLSNVPPGAPGLAGLTSLSLTHVDITDDAVRDTVACCRLLEFLSLRNCHLLKFVRIAGENLRGLEVVGCLDVRQLQVAAPALESFAFHGDILYFKYREDESLEFEPVEFIGKGNNTQTPSEATPLLRDAYLSHIGFGVYDDPLHEFAFSNLMEKVAHAKILTICSVGLLHIEETCNFYELMIDTPNLQELQLLMDSMDDDDVTRISGFFHPTPPPLLERLFIRLPAAACEHTNSGGATAIGNDEDIVLDFEIALDHLTFIKLVNFRGTRREMRLLRFVLRRAPILEHVVLLTPEEEGRALRPGDDDQNQQLLKIVQEHVSEIGKAFLWREAHVVVCRPREDCSRSPAHTKYYHDD